MRLRSPSTSSSLQTSSPPCCQSRLLTKPASIQDLRTSVASIMSSPSALHDGVICFPALKRTLSHSVAMAGIERVSSANCEKRKELVAMNMPPFEPGRIHEVGVMVDLEVKGFRHQERSGTRKVLA